VFHAVSYLLGCLPKLSNINNQVSIASCAFFTSWLFWRTDQYWPCCIHSDTRVRLCL